MTGLSPSCGDAYLLCRYRDVTTVIWPKLALRLRSRTRGCAREQRDLFRPCVGPPWVVVVSDAPQGGIAPDAEDRASRLRPVPAARTDVRTPDRASRSSPGVA